MGHAMLIAIFEWKKLVCEVRKMKTKVKRPAEQASIAEEMCKDDGRKEQERIFLISPEVNDLYEST